QATVKREAAGPNAHELQGVRQQRVIVKERVADPAAGQHADDEPADEIAHRMLRERDEALAPQLVEDPAGDEESGQIAESIPPHADRAEVERDRVPAGERN